MKIERDLEYLESMATEIKPYLLGKDLYWTLHGPHGVLPLGTLGGMMLRLHCLDALHGQMSRAQIERFESARASLQSEMDHWRVQAEEKMAREAEARLQNWTAYLEELRQNRSRFAPDYRTQVEGRTIIEFLREYAGSAFDGHHVTKRIMGLDHLLGELTESSDFILEDELQTAFPRERCWWLYAYPIA